MRRNLYLAMKNRFFLIVLLVFSVLCVDAEIRPLSNHLYVSLGGEYVALRDNQRIARPYLGGGGEFGFGYELQYNRFLFDVGLAASFEHATSKVSDTTIVYNALDTEGDSFKYSHLYRKNTYGFDALNLNVPVLFGSRIGDSFYFLAGARVSANLYGYSSSRALLTTTGKYDKYIGDFATMPNHEFVTDKPVYDGRPVNFNVNVAVGGEIGLYLNQFTDETGFDVPKHNVQLRLSVFAYYGLLDIHPKAGGLKTLGNMFEYSGGGEKELIYSLNSVYLSDPASDAKISNITAGIRFTVLFRLPEPKECVMCYD